MRLEVFTFRAIKQKKFFVPNTLSKYILVGYIAIYQPFPKVSTFGTVNKVSDIIFWRHYTCRAAFIVSLKAGIDQGF